jgi:polar amino acid transport system ATP-binding protein/sulfate transport system ATP-binding protein
MVEITLGEILLEIKNISVVKEKVSGEKITILRNVNESIYNIIGHGQVVGILGPSGVGKTTLFNAISGMEKPTEGSVLVNCDGAESNMQPVQRGHVGVVAQNYPLLSHRTVLSNLIVAAKMKNGSSKKDIKERAMAMLEDFELADKAGCYPIQLSGGQRQRIAIAQQLLCSEHYLLMDEPFSGLDPIAKHNVRSLVTRVAEMNEKNTIIVTSHDIDSAVCVSDTLWLMGRDRDEKGNIIPGAYVKKIYNLAQMGLAWHQDVELMPEFAEMVRELKLKFKEL